MTPHWAQIWNISDFIGFHKIQSRTLRKLYFHSPLSVLGILGPRELTDISFGSTIACGPPTFGQTYLIVHLSHPTHEKLNQSVKVYSMQWYSVEIYCSLTHTEVGNLIQLSKLWYLVQYKRLWGIHIFHAAVADMARDLWETCFFTHLEDGSIAAGISDSIWHLYLGNIMEQLNIWQSGFRWNTTFVSSYI